MSEQELIAERPSRASWWRVTRSYLSAQFRSGLTRIEGAIVPNTQSAVAATLSWVICYHLLNITQPIFAPIATYLCLGFSRNRVPRKVLEVGLGATFGVLLGDLIGHYWSFGWWQLLLIILVTPLLGRFIDRSDLLTFQIAVNCMVVASFSLIPAMNMGPVGRWESALIGVAVALAAAYVLPSSVTKRPRRYAVLALEETARAMDRVSAGLRSGDSATVLEGRSRLGVVREALDDGLAALASAQETAAINPVLARNRPELAELDRILELTGRLHVSVTMLTRQSRGMVSESGPMPPVAAITKELAALVHEVAGSVREWAKPTLTRNKALDLAQRLSPADLADPDDWRSMTLLSLLRAITVDLLQLTGLSMVQARSTLADSQQLDAVGEEKLAVDEEKSSRVWGTRSLPAVPPDVQQEPDAEGQEPVGN